MDKNSKIGMVVIMAILGIFWWVQQPSQEEQERLAQEQIKQKQEQVEAQKLAEERARTNAETNVLDSTSVDSTQNLTSRYGLFANAVVGEQNFTTLENDLIKVTFSNKGGKVYSVEIKDYKKYGGEPLVLFDGDDNKFGFNFYHNNRPFKTDDLFFSPKVNGNEISYTVATANNQYLRFKYTLHPDEYMLDFSIEQNNMNGVIQTNRGSLDFEWQLSMYAQEKGRKNELQGTGVYYRYQGDEVDEIKGGDKSEELRTPLQWVAFKDQFFSSIMVAKDRFSAGDISLEAEAYENTDYIARATAEMSVPVRNQKNSVQDFELYFGPNHFPTFKQYEDYQFTEIIPLGWGIFGWINQFLVIPVFNFLQSRIASYGLIILILTLIVKFLLFPLTYRSYKSTAKMRVLKPQIDEINEKIPADKAMERQQAQMKLYKKVGVSPLGGCLPMLVQMPFLLAMFRFFPSSIELRQQAFLWADDLSTYDSIFSWTSNIPIISSFYGNHISLFALLMAAVTLIYNRINQNMTQQSSSMPGMKFMMNFMPIMLLFFFNNYSSGLTYYYFLSTSITIFQTMIMRSTVNEEALLAKLNAHQKKPKKKKSGFQSRLEEAMRERQKMQNSSGGGNKKVSSGNAKPTSAKHSNAPHNKDHTANNNNKKPKRRK